MKGSELRFPRPNVHPERCTRVRFSESQCRLCRSICPSRSIRFRVTQLEIDHHCTGCGFCVALCPNEVFEYPVAPSPIEGALYCSVVFAEKLQHFETLPPFVTPCIGSLSSSILLDSMLTDENPLHLVVASCKGCLMELGCELFRKTEGELESLFDLLGVAVPPARTSVATGRRRNQASTLFEQFRSQEEERKRCSRREFFRHLRSRALPSSRPEHAYPREPQTGTRRPTEKSRRLVALLRKFAPHKAEEYILPGFLDIHADEKCTGCGACAALCPTGALHANETGSAFHLQWIPAHCSQCGLCFEVCARKALHKMEGLRLSRIAEESESLIRKIPRRACRECGEAVLSEESAPLCSRCVRQGDLMNDVSRMINGKERRTVW